VAPAGHGLGQPDRHLDRLGAAAVEGGAIEPVGDDRGQRLQVGRVLGGVENGGVEAAVLLGDGGADAGVPVAEGGDAHGGGEVEVAATAVVDEVRPLPVGDHQAGVLGDAPRAPSGEAADGVLDVRVRTGGDLEHGD
jgi:hypothetical protein